SCARVAAESPCMAPRPTLSKVKVSSPMPQQAAPPILPPMLMRIVIGCYAVVSLITFIAYAVDKRSAVRQRRRISEGTLHLLELLGGWPGALLAQTIVRHKRRKTWYMADVRGDCADSPDGMGSLVSTWVVAACPLAG